MKCRFCKREMTKYTVGQRYTNLHYNNGDIVAECENRDCEAEGSTRRIKKAKRENKGDK